ncbi:MAG: ATP-binding protein [Verrucomicrobiia bacterium]
MTGLWALPPEEQSRMHRIRMEVLLYYCNTNWNVFWGNSDGLDTFLPLRGIPVPIKAGERIFIDGQILPANHEFLWDRTLVKILSESNEVESISAQGRLLDAARLDKHFVEVEARVVSQSWVPNPQTSASVYVLKLGLRAQNFNFDAFVNVVNPSQTYADLTGKVVRISGVYSGAFDAPGTMTNLTLWTPDLNHVEIVGSLKDGSRSSKPATSSENSATTGSNLLVRSAGTVRSQHPLTATAQGTNGRPVLSEAVITNMNEFWAIPLEEKGQPHRVRMDLLIYYCDTNWNVYWGDSDGLDTFLPLRGIPVSLKAGDEISIDGRILPVNQECFWDRTSVKILSESNEIKTLSAKGRLLDVVSLDKHFVEVDALVDSQSWTPNSQAWVSMHVLKLGLLGDNLNFDAFVNVANPEQVHPDLAGKFVRISGVYSETLDAFGKIASLTLWTPDLDHFKVIGSLQSDPRFSVPVTASENFAMADPKTLVCVAGVVRSQQPGQAVTIWDDSGQIRILTKQFHPLQRGDYVEAVGYPAVQGLDRILRDGLFRLTTNNVADGYGNSTNHARLRLADQVRGLDEENIARHLPVTIEGVVTWVDPRRGFIFVMDSSGGIRVMRPHLLGGRRFVPGMLVKVDGVAAAGEFAPVITNAVARQTGTMVLPDDAPLISLEQALTGTADGRWVQMRGYVRKVTDLARITELQLVAPGGEFTVRLPRDESLKTLQGSVMLACGVCVVDANARRQLTGIEVWSPGIEDIQVEQTAPADVFALPMRSIASLRQFNLFNTLNERVHTAGSVTLNLPGHYLYVQDGDSSILALSEQTDPPLHPGDRVEVVGFSGNDSGNFVLREAVYRRISAGSEPVPVQLSTEQTVNEDLDGLLVRAEGLLLDVVEKPDETRLVIQWKGVIFEAKLDQPGKFAGGKPELGSKLALTGVYRIQRDEYGKPHSFLLNLRDGSDVRVLAPPPWWTLRRLLLALAGVGLISLLALLWTEETRRKNSQLLRAQVELKAAHDKLEERVLERTRNLQEANEALRRSEERFVKAFRASPVPLLLQSARDQRFVDVNESFLHLTGFKREEVLEQTPAGLKLFSQPETGREISDALSAKRLVRNLQTELAIRNGKPLTVLVSAEAFELESQSHFLMSIQDITERINVENQLRQAQKMEVVGQIAAGIAHDFNNILTVIQGHAEIQLNVEKLDESLADSLREISRAAARAASLTRQLLAFSRKQMLQRRPLDVRESLNNTSKMLRRIIGEHISLRIECAENLPPVFADAVNFEQIIINLAVNARDAMPRGGPLTITAGLAVIDAKYLEREPDAVIGTFIRLSVADEGIGMDETVRSKIFEPFFTTKDVGKGTGMGLATVYGIVKQHQGWIEVESKPGAGSVFKVFLPVAEQEAQATSESGTDLIPAAGVPAHTILLVEDEAALREMASTVLKRLGHQVVTAQDGPEALSLWPQYRGKIDLLFTDMVMPGGMTGRELADRLLRDKPQMHVIYSSGYSMDLFDSGMNLIEGVNCLLKPYDATTLARVVKKTFANGD